MKRADLKGEKFGKLTVIDFYSIDKWGQSKWLCECECGNKTVVSMNNLKRGTTVSCGCRKYERFGENLTGKQFGRLSVISFDHMESKGRSYWLCECSCGKRVVARRDQLLSGHTTSCGCYAIDNTRERATKHGLSNERLYDIWRAMRYRCRNETDSRYFRYGGRGIKVCDEWNDFETFYNWAMQNGYEPNLSIDRIDNDGDYCPENCRWVNDITQANNKCTNRNVEYNGVTHTVSEWARLFGVHKETLRYRINHADMRDFEAYFGVDISKGE